MTTIIQTTFVRAFARAGLLVALLAAVFHAAAQEGSSTERVDGAALYTSHCSTCHQPDGEGVPGAYPPLAGHITNLYAQEGGPGYLVRVVLHGMQGPITVGNSTFAGAMPGWSQLDDVQVAAILNHELTAWGNREALPAEFEPIGPDQVAEARTEDLTPEEVHALRPEVVATEASTEPANEAAGDDGAQPSAAQSVWDGVYAEAQAERARDPYAEHCATCHGADLGGGESAPQLTGGLFMLHWAGEPVANLFDYVRTQMPLGNPGTLSDQTYADLVALILQENDFPAGEMELPPDMEALQQIVIEREE